MAKIMAFLLSHKTRLYLLSKTGETSLQWNLSSLEYKRSGVGKWGKIFEAIVGALLLPPKQNTLERPLSPKTVAHLQNKNT